MKDDVDIKWTGLRELYENQMKKIKRVNLKRFIEKRNSNIKHKLISLSHNGPMVFWEQKGIIKTFRDTCTWVVLHCEKLGNKLKN